MVFQEKYALSLEKAKKQLETADHLTYITIKIVQEKKLLLKILENISTSAIHLINSVLQYEYLYKRIELYKDPRENFRTFERIAERYGLSQEQVKKIKEILDIAKKHKESPFEFVKNDKVVIMSNDSKIDTLTIETIKGFLLETKDFFRKVNLKIKAN
ncbi:MAG: hypothetical protein ABIG37_03920 [Nanoarchaeota archaeon]|nr:hypothetical protein [Nanoarchaeota archaeon]